MSKRSGSDEPLEIAAGCKCLGTNQFGDNAKDDAKLARTNPRHVTQIRNNTIIYICAKMTPSAEQPSRQIGTMHTFPVA